MTTEATDRAVADARRLLECDGPHIRKWMQDTPDEFIAAVHRVAALAVAPPATAEPLRPQEPSYVPPVETPRESGLRRAPFRRG